VFAFYKLTSELNLIIFYDKIIFIKLKNFQKLVNINFKKDSKSGSIFIQKMGHNFGQFWSNNSIKKGGVI